MVAVDGGQEISYSQHPDSAAFFASNVPLTSMPRRLDDLFGLMAAEAGIAGTIS